MNVIKCSEFFARKDLKPFLMGAFYSRTILTNNGKYICTTASYKRSEKVFECDFDFDGYKFNEYLKKINYFSGFQNWFNKSKEKITGLPRADFLFVLENDLGLTEEAFFRLLYRKIVQSEWIHEEGLTEDKKFFIRGYVELRGSVDPTAKYITQDYFYNSLKEVSKARLLFDFLDVPIIMSNLNFRQLQNQYRTGVNKRNPQFRLNINWYITKIGLINKYKALIFKNCYIYTKEYNDNNDICFFETVISNPKNSNFTKYIEYYSNNIHGKNLPSDKIDLLRKELNFTDKSEDNGTNRDSTIIRLFRSIEEDKCAVCDTTETFINNKTNRHTFDIHHMISLKNGKSLDNISNLVKVCGTCHNMLKKGSGRVEDQINAIRKILTEKESIFEFASIYYNEDDIEKLTKLIQEALG